MKPLLFLELPAIRGRRAPHGTGGQEDAYFGGCEKFAENLENAGATQFGSGWARLVLKDGRLEALKTANADTPVTHGIKPLLTIDVWEHAYYRDYQNRRPDFLQGVIDNLINRDFVNSRLTQGGAPAGKRPKDQFG